MWSDDAEVDREYVNVPKDLLVTKIVTRIDIGISLCL